MGNVNRCERGPEKLVSTKKNCIVHFGFTCLTFFKKKSCMNGKKFVYSICKTVLPVLISCSQPIQTRIKYGAWPYSNT